MKVYYSSMTGNVKRFIGKLNIGATNINEESKATEPFVLVAYTFGFGEVPRQVDEWLSKNGELLRGVAVSGNRNWGSSYGLAGDKISQKYDVPLLLKFEQAGTQEDIERFKERLAML